MIKNQTDFIERKSRKSVATIRMVVIVSAMFHLCILYFFIIPPDSLPYTHLMHKLVSYRSPPLICWIKFSLKQILFAHFIGIFLLVCFLITLLLSAFPITILQFHMPLLKTFLSALSYYYHFHIPWSSGQMRKLRTLSPCF